MLRMQWFKENYLNHLNENQTVTVLDVGSQCVSEQIDTYKILFNKPPFKYVGLDMMEGNNVDIVVKKAYQWDEVPDNFCDIIITGQTFEHIEFPWLTIAEMARVLKTNGLMCIIVPSMQALHRYPVNCQNYFSDGLIALAKYTGLSILHTSTNYAPIKASLEWYYRGTHDSMLIAKKTDEWKADLFDKTNYICVPADLEKMATGLVSLEKQGKWYILKYKIKKTLDAYRKKIQK
jgi:SAM-dependent methyltransferase